MTGIRIENIGVLGAGLMGHGIAQLLAVGGCRVKLFDQASQMLDTAFQRMADNLQVFLGLGMITQDQIDQALARITLAEDVADLCRDQ
ncbi:MAG: 3-hydroxyacyl-CoA dehydrogenase NAD-binding domain-containing protein, partial [Pseudomonadota bacterium]